MTNSLTDSERVPSAAVGDHNAPTAPRTGFARGLATGEEHGELEDGTTCAVGRLACWDCGHGLSIDQWSRTLPEDEASPGARLGAALAAESDRLVENATPVQQERLARAVLRRPLAVDARRTVGGGLRLLAVLLDIQRPLYSGPDEEVRVEVETITLAIGRARGPAWGATVILDSRTGRDWPGELTQGEFEQVEALLARELVRLCAGEVAERAERGGRLGS